MPRLKVVAERVRRQTTFTEQKKQSAKGESRQGGDEQFNDTEKIPPPASPTPNSYSFERILTSKSLDENDEPRQSHVSLSSPVDSDDLMKRLRRAAGEPEKSLPIPPRQRFDSVRPRRRHARPEEICIDVNQANDVENEAMSDDPRINNYVNDLTSVRYQYPNGELLGTPAILKRKVGRKEMGAVWADGSGNVANEVRKLEESVRWTRRRSVVEKIAEGIEGAWVERGCGRVAVWSVRTREGQALDG